MIIEILLVVTLFLWFLSLLPIPQMPSYTWATSWLAWISVVLITVHLFGAFR